MSEYVFRYANGYGCDMSALMDGGRQTVGEYFASDATDHYGTLHEEIVRCRDCRWIHMFLDYERTYPEITMYTAYECACLNRRIYDMDMFCAWGVKRKEGE